MKYVMLICDSRGMSEGIPEEQLKKDYENIYAYIAKWEALGKWAGPGAELEPPSLARTIRHNGSGPVVTDGPYTDIKEVVGGFMLIEAVDMDEAVAIASGWPTLHYGGSVEVRPVASRS